MKDFRADLHIHTLLSPCGDLSMSPATLVNEAARKGIDIIGITDHNSTRHCRLVSRLAAKIGIFTLMGAEVTTKEEVHCLAFFEEDKLDLFQDFLDARLPDIKNDPLIFGDQVVIDEDEMIVHVEERLLISATDASLEEVGAFVRHNGGIFIPAHIDRMRNSIYSQLGFLPDHLQADALEVSRRSRPREFVASHPGTGNYTVTTGSDAHYPENIGDALTIFTMEEASFGEIRMALAGVEGRKTTIP